MKRALWGLKAFYLRSGLKVKAGLYAKQNKFFKAEKIFPLFFVAKIFG